MAKPSHVLFFILILALGFQQVARCLDDSDAEVSVSDDVSDIGIVNEDESDFEIENESLIPAPGVDTACVFPQKNERLVAAGEETELLVGIKNDGHVSLNVVAITASIHLSYDHRMLVQNLTTSVFQNLSAPASSQSTLLYVFAVSKYLQPGNYDMVGNVVYEINNRPYRNTFYNGTIEVMEPSNFFSIESVFLVTLGLALLALLGLWIYGQAQNFSKKAKKAPKVEAGTASTDASLDEWLQGTAYMRSALSRKSKKIAG